MLEDVEVFYSVLESSGFPKRYTHNMADYQVSQLTLIIYDCFALCLIYLANSILTKATSLYETLYVRFFFVMFLEAYKFLHVFAV